MFKKLLKWVEKKLFGPEGAKGLWPENSDR